MNPTWSYFLHTLLGILLIGVFLACVLLITVCACCIIDARHEKKQQEMFEKSFNQLFRERK